jgi:uncharacterized membrane protein
MAVTTPSPSDTRSQHPAVLAQQAQRLESLQFRIADQITAFAGSMRFVYIHVVLFAVWMVLIERSPWPTLTLVVSLEAIFLSTFVMIGQNRQSAFQQAKADHDYQDINLLLEENTALTRTIHQLTSDLRDRLGERSTTTGPPDDREGAGGGAPSGGR